MQLEKKLNDLERQKNVLANDKLVIESRHVERAKSEAKKVELESNVKASDTDLLKIEEKLTPLAEKVISVVMIFYQCIILLVNNVRFVLLYL